MDASIIVPVYNDPEGIRDTITSILALDYPTTDYEILVVDNGSTDNTREVARDLTKSTSHAKTLVEDTVQSSYAARNKGISHATGEILAFIDADMTVPQTWLSELVAFYNKTDAVYVGCNVELDLSDEKLTLMERYSLAKEFPIEFYIRVMNFVPTCCLSVDRMLIEQVGMFSNELLSGGDTEFGKRVEQAGYQQHFAEDITMYHPARNTFRQHLSKAIRVGRGREQRYQNGIGGRVWYHPRNVAPPHPGRFRDRIHTDESTPVYLAFYLITYMFKIGQLYGQLDERFGWQ